MHGFLSRGSCPVRLVGATALCCAGWLFAADGAGPAPAPARPTGSERIEFSGPSGSAASSPGLREVQDAGLELLEPSSSVGAVIGNSPVGRRMVLVTGPNAGNTTTSKRSSSWAFVEAAETDPTRAAEMAAGVRDTESILQAISRTGGRSADVSSSSANAKSAKQAAAFSRRDDAAFDVTGAGSLEAVLGSPYSASATDFPGANVKPGQPSSRVLSGVPVPLGSVAGIGATGMRLGELETKRSVREMLTGLPDRLPRQDRSLWNTLDTRDTTRQELNPVMPGQTSLEPVLSDTTRNPEAFRASEFGLPPVSPYSRSSSPLREMLIKINGPGAAASGAFQPPSAEVGRSAAPRPTFELPTRKF